MNASKTACPVCLAVRFRDTFEQVGHRFERCLDCGFERMGDPLGDAQLGAYYAEERAQGEACWHEHGDNLDKYGRMIGELERGIRPGRFLDVGCSLGTSLVAARDRGWDAVGIELSQPVAEFGREEWGLDIRTVPIEDAGFADASVDLLWMHHTLEHVPRPDRVLAECLRVLKPGGIMYQAMPNHGGIKSRLFGGSWSYGVTPEHVSLFSTRTLRLLVQRVGFRVQRHWTRSYATDPRLLLDLMHRLGRVDQLMRWSGRADGTFDSEAYLRYVTDRKLPNWFCSRMWPARLTELCGLGEEVHLVATRS